MSAQGDGWVTEARLRELLARQGEAFDLDYKRILDIQNNPRHRVKLVKLVAATTARAGDVVIGADPHGRPTGLVTPALAAVFDEANLSPILRAYLPPELLVHSQTHEIDGSLVTLIHIEAGTAGPLPLTADGVLENRRGHTVCAFRAGERYIRDGTRNALWIGDLHQVSLLFSRQATETPLDAVVAMTFESSVDTLVTAAHRLLGENNPVPLRGLLMMTPARVRTDVTGRNWDDVALVLDHLTVLACTYVTLRADDLAREVVEVLQRVFEMGFEESDIQRQTSDPWSWRLWLEVAARIEVIGALALRQRRWDWVRDLALWQAPQANQSIANWIRLAMRGRISEIWPRCDDGRPKSVPEVALEIAEALPHVADDTGGDGLLLRSSIGQFDLCACLASIAKLRRSDAEVLMIDSPRVAGREALVDLARQLLDPGPAREAIFPLDDVDLATALRAIENAWAGVYTAMYWYGTVGEFIKSQPEGGNT